MSPVQCLFSQFGNQDFQDNEKNLTGTQNVTVDQLERAGVDAWLEVDFHFVTYIPEVSVVNSRLLALPD